MKKLMFILIGVTFLVVTAFNTKSNQVDPRSETSSLPELKVKDYYFKQCTFCHNQGEKLAPYMPKIKKIYLMNYPDEIDFVNKVSDFVLQPGDEKRLYKVASYETMPPNMFHDPNKIRDVARYIYRNNEL